MRSIGGLFGKSPFGPMLEHAVKVNECVRQLRPLFEALIAGQHQEVERISGEISKLESSADALKNEIRDTLPRSLFLPAARSDLLVLLEVQDSVADAAEDVAGLLSIRKIAVPEDYRDDLLSLVDHALGSCDGVLAIFEQLKDLLEGTFRGKPVDDVFEGIRIVGRQEHHADSAGRALISKLYNADGDLTIAEFIIWDKLIKNLSKVSDLSEKVANRVRMLVAR